MKFKVVPWETKSFPLIPSVAYLRKNDWDDWGKFETQYLLVIYDKAGNRIEAGRVKFGERGLLPGGPTAEKPMTRSPSIPGEFTQLGDNFFSLGQDESYYEAINQLQEDERIEVFSGLRDCAFNLDIFSDSYSEKVMTESLLRGIKKETVSNRFHRLSHGNAELTEFDFEFDIPNESQYGGGRKIIDFHVVPNSEPPTNVHVIIGRNGSGKTRLMRELAKAVIQSVESERQDLSGFKIIGTGRGKWAFSGLVVISFSAFDVFNVKSHETSPIRVTKVGLTEISGSNPTRTLKDDLAENFQKSFSVCRRGLRRERWLAAITTLGNDELFQESEVLALLDETDESWEQKARTTFGRLSSGHGIVLLTVTRLVELVDENTLVLIDEPEGHLHPPLLSAFVRALSNLLVQRNGVAVIATHSPVVLQEVPKSCAWILRRMGWESFVDRPERETFGENVGILTREVFKLEVTKSGFHQLLEKTVEQPGATYESVVEHFGNQLGAEAKAIIRSLVTQRDPGT